MVVVVVALHAAAACGAPVHRLAFVQVSETAQQPAGEAIANTILAGRYVLGMQIALARLADVSATLRVVTEGFVCATDPMFNHDGTRLVFAGQRAAGERLGIWELAGDEAEPRPLVACDADCITPVYMPDGRVVFASLLAGEYEEHGGRYSFSLYELAPGQESPTRLTFNPSSDFDPVVLRDGRVLYSSWQHVGNHHWPRGVVALMLVNGDGTGLFPLTGNHRPPWLKRAGRPWIGDRIVFVQAERFADFGAGELVAASLNDAFAPYETLVPALQYQVNGVVPAPAGRLFATARPTSGTRATFGLYLLENGEMRLLYDNPEYHELAPAAGIPTGLPERRISTVVMDQPFGYLVVLNCYDTDRTDQRPVRKGSIKMVRVIEGRPLRRAEGRGPVFLPVPGHEEEPRMGSHGATGYIPARILGEVAPAADGSLYLKVPADRPLRIQLLDRDGFALVSERAWFWVRPNERRVCIGCHENRELSPRNATPLAMRHVPTDLTDPSRWQTVSFRKDIQPIVSMSCARSGCHVPPTPTAGMNLAAEQRPAPQEAALAEHYGPAYANLLRRQKNKPFAIGGRRVHPGDARASPLLWMLYGRALAPQYGPAPFERPMVEAHPGPMLPEAQLELIRKWVDLGAVYDDGCEPTAWPPSAAPVGEVQVER